MDFAKIPYRSIACGTYDLFEAAALQRHPVRLRMADGSEAIGRIADVFARGREEFCRFIREHEANSVEYRLDSIAEITDLQTGTRMSTGTC